MSVLIVIGDKTANEVLESATMAANSRFDRIEKMYFDPVDFTSRQVPRLDAYQAEIFFHVGIANPTLKSQIVSHCLSANWRPFTVIHPTASIAPSARLGEGVFVGAMAVISTNAQVGDFSIVHIHSTIGHDATIGAYNIILPGARISGSVVVGDRVLVGSNAFIAAGVRVGDDGQVDALTYVRNDVAASHLVSVRAPKPMKRVDI